MFAGVGVFTEKELHARNEVKWETYTKKIQIEARVLGDLATNHVVPVATRYMSLLLDNVYKLRLVYGLEKAEQLSANDEALIAELSERISQIRVNVEKMVEARKCANKLPDEREKAIAYHDNVLPYFDIVRDNLDRLELIVDDEMWPLPKYRELLFIR
jgi:glutamine synthetase